MNTSIVMLDQSTSGIVWSVAMIFVPTQVPNVYIGIIVHGFVTKTPTKVTILFNLNNQANAMPSTVWNPSSGEIPMNKPRANAIAILWGDSWIIKICRNLSLNFKMLVPFR